MMDEEVDLSPSGQARREEILRLAMSQARDRRARRQMIRAGVATVIFAAAGVVTFLNSRSQGPVPLPGPAPVVISPATAPESIPPPVAYIQTDPTIVERLSIHPNPQGWTVIGDDELLQALADAGHPAGIIYHDGRAELLPR